MSTNQTATTVANQHPDLGSVNFELESAIGLLKEAQGEEAISDLATLLEDCKQGDEVLVANASTTILRFYSHVRYAEKYILNAYKALNGKEAEL